MKTIYFTVEKELDEGSEALLSGTKFIQLYDIIKNKPVNFGFIECDLDDVSITMIQDYLNNKEIRTESFTFVEL